MFAYSHNIKSIKRSKLLHAGEIRGIADAFDDLVSVFDMFMEILYPRVEDVRQAMFPKILERKDAIRLCISIFSINPNGSQLGYGVEIITELFQGLEELVVIDPQPL